MIDLNKKDDINNDMVKKREEDGEDYALNKDFLEVMGASADNELPQEEAPAELPPTQIKTIPEPVPNESETVPLTKKEEKKLKKELAKKVKVVIGDQEYMVPKTMVFNYAKKEYKIEENSKKIANAEVAVLYLRESGIAELKYVKPNNGMFIVDGRYYHIVESCSYSIGKKRIPLAIIPEWSFIPVSKKEYEIILGAKYQDAQMLIIKSLENAEIVKIQQEGDHKKPADSKLIIGILIAAVIGLFVLNKIFGSG